MDIDLTDYPEISVDSAKVYSGIYRAVHENLDEFERLLSGVVDSSASHLYFSGHSLGSGFAQIMFLHMFRDQDKLQRIRETVELRLTSFGGPAVMERKLAEALEATVGDDRMYLVKKEDDPVPFTGEAAHQFLSEVLQKKRDRRSFKSISVQFLKMKMRKSPFNRELGLKGLQSVRDTYAHLGHQVVVRGPEGTIRVLHHSEYLDASVFDLSAKGNAGWYLRPAHQSRDISFAPSGIDALHFKTTDFEEEVHDVVFLSTSDAVSENAAHPESKNLSKAIQSRMNNVLHALISFVFVLHI